MSSERESRVHLRVVLLPGVPDADVAEVIERHDPQRAACLWLFESQPVEVQPCA